MAEIRELLSELNNDDLKQPIREFVEWEVNLAREISGQQVGPGDILDAIDKVREWIKKWLEDMRSRRES